MEFIEVEGARYNLMPQEPSEDRIVTHAQLASGKIVDVVYFDQTGIRIKHNGVTTSYLNSELVDFCIQPLQAKPKIPVELFGTVVHIPGSSYLGIVFSDDFSGKTFHCVEVLEK